MFKVKIQAVIIYFVLFLAASLSSRAADEVRKPGSFKELKVNGRFNVVLVKGTEESVSLSSNETNLENVLTEIENGKLKVRMKSNYFKETEVKVVITYKQLSSVSATMGAVIDGGSIEFKKLSFHANSGAEIKSEVIADSLNVEVTQGATLTLSGQAVYEDAQVSTGGQLSAFLLNSNSVKVRVTMGGYAKVYVKDKVDASVNMGGNVTYKGNPKEVKQGTTMGGTITQIRE